MKELQRKHKIRRVLYSIPALILLLVLTIVLTRGAIRVMGKRLESAEYAKELEQRATALVLREQELEESIARLETEEGKEEEIRERFSVTQEGEYVAVIVDDRNASTTTVDTSLPWYKRLWDAIIPPYE